MSGKGLEGGGNQGGRIVCDKSGTEEGEGRKKSRTRAKAGISNQGDGQ